jgi:16S rRNA (guanine966-N2)-methyltransferase
VRIVAGRWRGRTLATPAGDATRPTADRMRQALFDMLMHAPWGGLALLEGAGVLDAFAGTGARGLEALSRGAARAWFIERDRAALAALRANIAATRAEAQVVVGDATRPPPGTPCRLVFLDPPYGQGLAQPAVAALSAAGWIAPDAILVLETARDEDVPTLGEPLAERAHGAARVTLWRSSLSGGRTAARSPPC